MADPVHIEVGTIGRRHYFRGNTYSLKENIRELGAHWDPDQKAWWIGDRKRAEAFAAKAEAGEIEPKGEFVDWDWIESKVTYKGRDYWLVKPFDKQSRDRVKLAFLSREGTFWADRSLISNERYHSRYSEEDDY